MELARDHDVSIPYNPATRQNTMRTYRQCRPLSQMDCAVFQVAFDLDLRVLSELQRATAQYISRAKETLWLGRNRCRDSIQAHFQS